VSIGAALAHARGGELEAWLSAKHERALARGLLAKMAHVGPPSEPHVVGGVLQRDRRGRVLAAITGVGPADYQGQLPGGRSVALEAKSRAGPVAVDSDAAWTSAKGVRDEIAAWCGVDDGDSAWTWDVCGEVGKGYAVRVTVASREGAGGS
jgi:hypothetical protein